MSAREMKTAIMLFLSYLASFESEEFKALYNLIKWH